MSFVQLCIFWHNLTSYRQLYMNYFVVKNFLIYKWSFFDQVSNVSNEERSIHLAYNLNCQGNNNYRLLCLKIELALFFFKTTNVDFLYYISKKWILSKENLVVQSSTKKNYKIVIILLEIQFHLYLVKCIFQRIYISSIFF